MEDLSFNINVGRPNIKDYRVLEKGMLLYHAEKGHPRRSELIHIFLKDKNAKVRGGVLITILWNGMEINALWVDKSIRNKGWGRRLLEAAEHEGKIRGCTIAYTNTFSWQAPEFYAKFGYKPFGKLVNFPEGNELTYLSKNL